MQELLSLDLYSVKLAFCRQVRSEVRLTLTVASLPKADLIAAAAASPPGPPPTTATSTSNGFTAMLGMYCPQRLLRRVANLMLKIDETRFRVFVNGDWCVHDTAGDPVDIVNALQMVGSADADGPHEDERSCRSGS